ncbi:MAG: GNAT family N-acetyltransferase [Candidatus Eiseniibacteriota bacterium]
MSLHVPDLGALETRRLVSADLVETFAFLDGDPVLNVYLLAVLMRDSLGPTRNEFWAVRRGGRMAAMVMIGTVSGSVLPVGADAPALERLAAAVMDRRGVLPRRFQVIGMRDATGPLLAAFARAAFAPRLEREQVYMSVERGRLERSEPLSELRTATPEDYALIEDSGALLRAEELEEDPRISDPRAYARRVEEECRDGFTFLWRTREGLRFRASVSARTADAAQISGVYTPPEWRGRGFATRGVGELCRRMFEQSRHACLFVNDTNAPALAVYRRLGFLPVARWRSAFYDSGA